MKLYRFTATSTHRAIFTATEALGPNALVYSTRKVPGGVEVLAGLPFGADDIIDHSEKSEKTNEKINIEKVSHKGVKIQEATVNHKIIESLQIQIESMNDSIQVLSNNITMLQQSFAERLKNKNIWKSIFLKKIDLSKLFKIKIHSREVTN